jgi:hypothetical protein
MENRLCGDTGEAVIAEFGFKGSFEEVKQSLWNLLDEIRKNGFQESDRDELFVRHQRLRHWESVRIDNYIVEYEKFRKKDLNKAIKILDARRKSKNFLHYRKECICFCNI